MTPKPRRNPYRHHKLDWFFKPVRGAFKRRTFSIKGFERRILPMQVFRARKYGVIP